MSPTHCTNITAVNAVNAIRPTGEPAADREPPEQVREPAKTGE